MVSHPSLHQWHHLCSDVRLDQLWHTLNLACDFNFRIGFVVNPQKFAFVSFHVMLHLRPLVLIEIGFVVNPQKFAFVSFHVMLHLRPLVLIETFLEV